MQDHQFKAKGFLIWGICASFFLYEFLLRTIVGAYQSPVMNDLGLTSFQFSLISTTVFFMVYGAMQVPAGIIVDHIGLKKSLLIGAAICAFASAGFAYAETFMAAVVFRFLMGLGASFGFVCLLISVNEWMPHRHNALFIGLSQFIGTIGPILAAGPIASVSGDVSWQHIFLYLGVAGIIVFALVFLFVENNHEKSGRYIILYKPETVGAAISKLFSRPQPWFIAICSAGLYFTLEYLSENEGRQFLAMKGISLQSASYMLTIAWIGYGIGCPLLGFLSDLIERRKIIMVLCALLGLLAITSILYLPGKLTLQFAFFALGMSAAGQTIGFSMMSEQFKKQFVAAGFGLNNGMITIVSAINAPLIGFLLDQKKQGEAALLSDYQTVFYALIVVILIALFGAIFLLRETYCKNLADFTYLKRQRSP